MEKIKLAIIFGGSLPFEETDSLLYVLENFDEIINLCSSMQMDPHQI